jgi:Lecithin retinol acyltransferase
MITQRIDGPRSVVGSLAPGTQLIVERHGYRHHGIYVGSGRVIHYAGRFRYPLGLIEEVSIASFIGGRPLRIGRVPGGPVHGEDVVSRARSRLGERGYNLLTNNCEHFVNWCQLGEQRSPQIDSLARPLRFLVCAAEALTILAPITKWKAAKSHTATFIHTVSTGDHWKKLLESASLIDREHGLFMKQPRRSPTPAS